MENIKEEMDVRVLIPTDRHKLLLKTFDELPVGERFVFINDHDPIPLFYEFKSIHGDVVGWEYLNRGGREWIVEVTRMEESKGVDFKGVNTLMDLRKMESDQWKHVVFHRYGMMLPNEIMELIASSEPEEIRSIFERKFADKHKWNVQKNDEGEYVVHIQKLAATGLGDDGFMVVNEMDLRPFPPAKRHDMFYDAFHEIKPGEAFEFINDHDPKPLYYQMEAESKEPFKWEYLEQGPVEWKVRVVKTSLD